MPCSYAIVLIFSQRQSLEPYLPASLSTETWIALYTEATMLLVDIRSLKLHTYTRENSDSDSDSNNEGEVCNLLLTRIPRGRPRKKRIDKATYRALHGADATDMLADGRHAPARRAVHCSTCGETGHYASTCKRPHN
jgi:hypothetical protein